MRALFDRRFNIAAWFHGKADRVHFFVGPEMNLAAKANQRNATPFEAAITSAFEVLVFSICGLGSLSPSMAEQNAYCESAT